MRDYFKSVEGLRLLVVLGCLSFWGVFITVVIQLAQLFR